MNENVYKEIIEELIDIVDTLCDCITNLPAACDYCPFGDHRDTEECEAVELLNKARKIIK